MPLRSDRFATHGAVMLDSNTVRFALWAPAARSVEVCLAPDRRLPLQRGADGWFRARWPAVA
ncbi:MAG: hypothetical protein ACRESP_22355, partial [Pseudomonas sp.]